MLLEKEKKRKKKSSQAPSSITSDLKELNSGPNETNATIH